MTCLLANIFNHETQGKEKFKGVLSLFSPVSHFEIALLINLKY